MPSLTLLLVLSVTVLPALECFLVSPRASTHQGLETPSPKPGVLPAWRTLRKPLLIQNRPYGHPRSSPLRRRPPHSNSETTGPLAAAAAETTGNAGSDDINKTDPQQQLPRSKPQRRRNTKRPREHVPVASAGVDEKSKPRLIDGGQEGSVPWSGADPPPTSPFGEPTYSDRVKFSNIMDDVLGCEAEADLPSTLTQHVEFLLSVDVTRLTNDLIKQEPTISRIRVLHNAYDFIVSFLEGVVENTMAMQKENREILRDIIETAKVGPEQFEAKMIELEDKFSYQFVKYLNAEIERLEKSEKSPGAGEAQEVLNVMKIVRVRVCAQVDLMFGEDVAVLSRLLSYDDRYMMRAALREVLGDFEEKQVDQFGKLVENTLSDVNKMDGADPLLRHKLMDMVDDIEVSTRELRASKEEAATKDD